MPRQGSRCFLVVRAQEWMCALPLEEVEETMRPLPVAPVSAAPSFVRGVCVMRGAPAPVVSLAMLLGGGQAQASTGQRFVSLRAPEGRLALEVEEVRGLRWLEEGTLDSVPALLRATASGHLQHLGSFDGRLLAVLGASHLLPEELWRRLESPAKEGGA
ncbi:chemotaxis protein CheW [Vitiosangium sp. GDMCC 1.1324]|uniref:chemotaxis protein CheW n=1 Tax=Vitiosangium sp. (strain GDMCC 1.1324) TaxID=2138576 RepID=UPI000D355BBC|nr:chemotaxis protein CheW [Vitiosangium sp. GDMCC 1.1324]PTL80637.1 chemotaxis protein CheW [Vitiosangium sp. GDMCC 1.1324]